MTPHEAYRAILAGRIDRNYKRLLDPSLTPEMQKALSVALRSDELAWFASFEAEVIASRGLL